MTRSRIRVFVAVLMAGALLSVPSVGASGGEVERAAQERQKFVLIQTDPRTQGGPLAATGPIHAHGTDVVLSEFRDRFKFPDGNVIIRHRPKDSTDSYDPVTCLFRFFERGTWRAVRGTGAYSDVVGHGRYRARGQGFACDENQPPEVFFVKIVARGPLSY